MGFSSKRTNDVDQPKFTKVYNNMNVLLPGYRGKKDAITPSDKIATLDTHIVGFDSRQLKVGDSLSHSMQTCVTSASHERNRQVLLGTRGPAVINYHERDVTLRVGSVNDSTETTETDSRLQRPADHIVVPEFVDRPSHAMLAQEYPDLVVPSSHVTSYSCLSTDLKVPSLDATYKYLTLSGWYYGPLTNREARKILKRRDIGTFLLRNSSDPKHLFSLSVKTERGTTSLRIRYSKGVFSLATEASEESSTRSSTCIMKLIENFVLATQPDDDLVLLETTGRMDTQFSMKRACLKEPSSLKHLCRLSLNRSLSDEQRSRLLIFMPPAIENYILDYPFAV